MSLIMKQISTAVSSFHPAYTVAYLENVSVHIKIVAFCYFFIPKNSSYSYRNTILIPLNP